MNKHTTNKHATTSVWRQAWQLSWASTVARRRLLVGAWLLIILCVLYPSDLERYRSNPPQKELSAWLARTLHTSPDTTDSVLQQSVNWVESRGRYIATGAQVLIPLVFFDKVGAVQLLYLGVTTTAVTHTLKNALNGVEVAGVPVGQRPNGGQNNVPSGHSSMAASALGFVWRRYGVFHVYYLLPLVLATMAARVLLSAHTLSAVLAGALLGLVTAYVLTTPRKPIAQ